MAVAEEFLSCLSRTAREATADAVNRTIKGFRDAVE